MAQHLARALGPFDAAMVVIGGIVGAGIFINPYIVAQRLDSPALAIGAWVVGGCVALAGALAYAELGAMFPQVGGQYVYLRDAYHPLVAFLYGWALIFMIEGGAIAAVALTFAEYTLRFATAISPAAATAIGIGGPRSLAIAAIVFVSAINYVGVTPGSRVLNVFVVLKTAALAVLIAAGLAASGATGAVEAPIAGSSGTLAAFGAALIPVMFAYGGWQNANYLAEEIRDPRRTLPVSLLAGTAVVVVIYVTVNLAYLHALGLGGLARTTTPAADAARFLLGDAGSTFVTLAIAVSTFGFLNLCVLAPTRVYYAMAADGVFLAQAARVHARYRTPSFAIVLQSSWAIVLVMTGAYGQLLDYVVFADWIFFGLTVGSVFVFRRRFPTMERPFKTWGYPVTPALFVLAAIGVVISAIRVSPMQSAIGAALMAAGIPAFFYWRRQSAGSARGAAEV